MSCPYCNSQNVLTFKSVTESILPRSVHNFENKLVSITPIICKDCHMGFNELDVDDKTRDSCFKAYEFIKANQGIGTSRFTPFLNIIKKYSKSSDTIVDIGCYDGFLLKELHKDNYNKLYGYDPSAQIVSQDGITIVKDYFNLNNKPKTLVDGIILGGIIGVVDDLKDFMQLMHKCLNKNGKLFIENPSIDGIHVLQKRRFCLDFFDKLAHDFLFNLIEATPIEKLSKAGHYQLVFEKIDDISQYKPYFTKEQKDSIFTTSVNLTKKDILDKDFVLNIKAFVKEHKDIVIYGGGVTTFNILNTLSKEQLSTNNIIILDSDESRHNALFTTPFNTKIKVQAASYYLKENKTCNLILGVKSPYYVNEIINTIKSLNHNIKRVLTIDGFKDI